LPTQRARFTVRGEGDRRSAVWTVKTLPHKGDAYMWPGGLARDSKISLHGARWRFGFTEEHHQGKSSIVPVDEDRAVYKWNRPPVPEHGVARCLVIVVPPAAVTLPQGPDEDDVVSVSARPEGWVWFEVVIARHGPAIQLTGDLAASSGPLLSLPLSGTETMSVLAMYRDAVNVDSHPHLPLRWGSSEQLRRRLQQPGPPPRVLTHGELGPNLPWFMEGILELGEATA
jgi:hypothetical protein